MHTEPSIVSPYPPADDGSVAVAEPVRTAATVSPSPVSGPRVDTVDVSLPGDALRVVYSRAGASVDIPDPVGMIERVSERIREVDDATPLSAVIREVFRPDGDINSTQLVLVYRAVARWVEALGKD